MNLRTEMLFLLLFFLLTPLSVEAVDISGVWDTEYNTMLLYPSGNEYKGEYYHDDGEITGTLDGYILSGWWREGGNTKACGPDDAWSGPIVFKYSEDESSFTGSWGYCGTDHADLDPDGRGWTGTKRGGEETLFQSECENSGKYYCDDACSIIPCDETMTRETCESLDHNWCDDVCQLGLCENVVTESGCGDQGLYYCDGECSSSPCEASTDAETVSDGDKVLVGNLSEGELEGTLQLKANFPSYDSPVDIWIIVFGPGKKGDSFGPTNLLTQSGPVIDDGFSYPKFAENESGPLSMDIGEPIDPCSSDYAGDNGDFIRWGVYYLVADHDSLSHLSNSADQILTALSNNSVHYYWFDAVCEK